VSLWELLMVLSEQRGWVWSWGEEEEELSSREGRAEVRREVGWVEADGTGGRKVEVSVSSLKYTSWRHN